MDSFALGALMLVRHQLAQQCQRGSNVLLCPHQVELSERHIMSLKVLFSSKNLYQGFGRCNPEAHDGEGKLCSNYIQHPVCSLQVPSSVDDIRGVEDGAVDLSSSNLSSS